MKKFYIILAVLFFCIGFFVYGITGDGAFKRKMSISGVVHIEIPEKKVTCFVDASAHGISCLPDWFIAGKQ
jgi:hypothetical protein